jgi:Zn-dependent peptidase ImmA (M78 family)
MTPKLLSALQTRSLDTVSGQTKIALDRLHAISAGADPTMGELRRLSEALKLSIADLIPPPANFEKANVLFRRTVQKAGAAEADLVDSISRRIAYSLDLIGDSTAWKCGWLAEFATGGETYAQAEQYASRFRELFYGGDNVSPLLSLPKLLVERLRVFVFLVNTSHLDGASALLDGTAFIFVARRFPARMLFTSAHELGHIIAHHDRNDFAILDTADEDFEARRPKGTTERFAHAFASCLLMPQAGVGIVLRKVREHARVADDDPLGDIEISYLARVFGVSFAAAARRCEDLKLLPSGGAASLNERLRKEYGSAEKRAEGVGLPPRPEIVFPKVSDLLLRSAIGKVQRGELSLGRASMVLGLSIPDLLLANAPTVH